MGRPRARGGPTSARGPSFPLNEGGEGARATQRETPRQTCPRPNGFGRNLRSKTRWFAGFCNSHQVSHFATFFIDARAEISVAESRFYSFFARCRARARSLRSGSLARIAPGFCCFAGEWRPPPPEGAPGALPTGRGNRREGADGRPASSAPPARAGQNNRGTGSRVVRPFRGIDNDPSAGSPTETLLRLLLPLNDKVQWTSHDVAGSEPPTSPRSEHFTGPFNR